MTVAMMAVMMVAQLVVLSAAQSVMIVDDMLVDQ